MNQNDFNTPETIVSTDYTVKNDAPIYAPVRDPRIDTYADSAFSKGLAATIMAWFPVTSIIAIIMGSQSLSAVGIAQSLAASCGTSAGGKCVAGKILGKIGKIGGIVMTAFWGFYILLIAAIIGSM